jgi:hypothetical protein
MHLLDPVALHVEQALTAARTGGRRLRVRLSGTPADFRTPTPPRMQRCCSDRSITSPSGRIVWRRCARLAGCYALAGC